MSKKIHIHTYGCQMNDYESDRTFRMFQDDYGYEWTDDPQSADLVVFNTCSIRDKADQKAFSAIGELREVKSRRKDMVVAVGGCLAQSQGETIRERYPFVDLVFGTHQWTALAELIEKSKHEKDGIAALDLFSWKNYAFLPYKESKSAHPVSELVTIQNGCDKFCTFCLVPFTRGRQVSRTPVDIISEVRMLTAKGVKEVMLLGQNVNAYGVDRSGEISFAELLRKLTEVQGLERLRFITSHPAELTFEAIDVMAESRIICEHLHLPIQSGSNRILEKMNRGYTVERYAEIVNYLREKMPDIALTTDVIVAFPGETESEFLETLKALEAFQFDDSYSFYFSPRLNTKAADWTDEFVDLNIAKDRVYRFQELQKKVSRAFREKWIGRQVEVLVEGTSKRGDDMLVGKTRQSWSVNFEAPKELIGQLVYVELQSLGSYTFKGKFISPKTLPVRVA